MEWTGPRDKVVTLSVALSIAVSKEEWTEAKHLKKELDDQWRLTKQEFESANRA